MMMCGLVQKKHTGMMQKKRLLASVEPTVNRSIKEKKKKERDSMLNNEEGGALLLSFTQAQIS